MFEQERVIVRLQQRVRQEATIFACFLSGSFGRRTQDDYSDLDVALVFADAAARDAAYANRAAFVQSVLPYVPAKSFDADHIRPYFHICLYSNGTKADYRYELRDTLEPDPRDAEIHILKDNGDWARQYQAACARLPLPRPTITAAELEALDNRFWVMFWDTYRLLRRGDWAKPFPIYGELFALTLNQLVGLMPPEDPVRTPLMHMSYSQDTDATLAHLRQLMDAYLTARAGIISRHHLLFTPNRPFEEQILRLLRK